MLEMFAVKIPSDGKRPEVWYRGGGQWTQHSHDRVLMRLYSNKRLADVFAADFNRIAMTNRKAEVVPVKIGK
jgi:hypothetical protein